MSEGHLQSRRRKETLMNLSECHETTLRLGEKGSREPGGEVAVRLVGGRVSVHLKRQKVKPCSNELTGTIFLDDWSAPCVWDGLKNRKM